MTAAELKKLTRGISAKRLAELTGKSTASIQAYSAGARPVPVDVALIVRALSDALDKVQKIKDEA